MDLGPSGWSFLAETPLSKRRGKAHIRAPTLRMDVWRSQTPTCRLAGKRLLENCIANTYNVLDSFMSKLLRVHGGCLGARSR